MSKKDNAVLGLIGCGLRPLHLFQHLPELGDTIRIRGLFDPNPEAVERARCLLKNNAPSYNTYQSLLENPDIDWVAIGSWNCYHREQVIAAFEAGKHVFCEKPLATTPEDCLDIYRAWKASGRHFVIGFTLRHSPHYLKVFELAHSGAIGNIISLEFNETLAFNHGGYIMADWRSRVKFAGTHLLEKCSHDIDLLNQLTRSRATRVSSFGGMDFFKPENAFHIDRLGEDEQGRRAYCTWLENPNANPFRPDKDIFDNQVALIEYENGIRAAFHTNCNAAIPERRMYVCGSEGAIRADVISGKIEMARIGFNEPIQDFSTGYSGGHGGGDNFLCRDLARCMLEDVDSQVGIEDGLKAAFTCFAIDEAAVTGRVVEVGKYWQMPDNL